MDESWRMRMGMPLPTTTGGGKNNPPRRRSTEDTSYRRTSESPLLDPEDFNDVFGGPPRTVMSRQFSGNEYFPRSSSTSFYEEIFKPAENLNPAPTPERGGRNLPEFRIPAEKGAARRSNKFEGFYSDIFGWTEEDVKRSRSRTRSRSKSKTSSSSVLSSEDLSPLRPAIGGSELGDQDVSLFASRLRPINVPRRWTSSRAMHEEHPEQHGIPAFSSNCHLYDVEYDYNQNFRGSHFKFCQRNPSPETISLEPNSYRSVKVSADGLELNNSPSSVVSSLCQDQEAVAVASRTQDEMTQEQGTEQDEDEVMSSYVIEINADNREWTEEAVGVDDAIAWAKEKFQTYCSADMLGADQISDGQKDGNGSPHVVRDEEPDTWINEEQKQQLDADVEMELLNEKIRLWSTGKEANIRLLLSTLHHILWPDSGWLAVPLTNLIESSHVKKAYQKARLFLHPDKLQQRGATFPQKYVAEKAFPILQDAWAAFVSQDVLCS